MLSVPLKIIARVKNGKLVVSGLNKFEDVLRNFEGEDVIVTVEELKNKRTLEQNAFLWGVYYPTIIDALPGHTKNELHEYFKEFLPSKYITVFGKEIKVEKSTTKLSTQEFSAFLDEICRTTGVPIPDTAVWKL